MHFLLAALASSILPGAEAEQLYPWTILVALVLLTPFSDHWFLADQHHSCGKK